MGKINTAIILGGTSAHISLIMNLKSRGYYTVLIDYYTEPVAKKFVDKHIQVSTLDKEKVLEISKSECASLVVATSIDQANVTASYVSEVLGLPKFYSFETAINVADKMKMKQKLIENNIPTATYIIVDAKTDLKSLKLSFPLIVKPSDSNGSKGVRTARNIEELCVNVDKALKISREGKVVVEEFKNGIEIGVDCIVENNSVNIIMTRQRNKIINNADIHQIYGSIWPAALTEQQFTQIKETIHKIAQVFHLNNTPLMVQAIINESELNIIEFAARIGGGENCKLIKLSRNIDLVDVALNLLLNNSLNLEQAKLPDLYADILLYTYSSNFGRIEGYEQLIENGTIEYLVCHKTKGMPIGIDFSSGSRVGAFVVKGVNINEIKENIRKTIDAIDVFDINGQSVLRKELYSDYTSYLEKLEGQYEQKFNRSLY